VELEDEGLLIQLLSDNGPIFPWKGVEMKARDLLIVSGPAWRRTGTLQVSGNLTVGEGVGQGSTGYLLEGNYEVREKLPFWLISGADPVAVKTGELRRGDVVAFRPVDMDNAVPVDAFLSPTLEASSPGFDLVAASELGTAELRIKSFGQRETQVSATWVDTALRDPVLAGFAAALGLLLAFVPFLSDLLSQRVAQLRGRRGNNDAYGSRAV
jgi:hypothetical protein